MICNTDQCTNTATHTDQFGHPICQECVDNAVEFGELPDIFKPILTYEDIDPAGTKEIVPRTSDQPVKCQTPDCKNPVEKISEAGDGICSKCLDFIYHQNPQHAVKWYPVEPAADVAAPASDALTIFEETLTEEGLAKINEKALQMPAIAKTKIEYDQVYEFSTALKRASVAARKKIKELKSDLKAQYNEAKGKIEKDLDFVLNIISPIITNLLTAREHCEAEIEAWKELAARKAAAELEKERLRKNAAKQKLLDDEKQRQAEAAELQAKKEEDLKLAAEKLERERYEFECDKTRLSADDAWLHWAGIIAEKERQDKAIPEIEINLTSPGPTDSDINELAEFAKNEPAEPVETIAIADQKIEVKESDTTVEIQEKVDSAMSRTDTIVTITADLIVNDPSAIPDNIALQQLTDDTQKIKNIQAFIETTLTILENHQAGGFESQQATSALYVFIGSIKAAADHFDNAVKPQEPETSDPGPGDDMPASTDTQECPMCGKDWPIELDECPHCGTNCPF